MARPNATPGTDADVGDGGGHWEGPKLSTGEIFRSILLATKKPHEKWGLRLRFLSRKTPASAARWVSWLTAGLRADHSGGTAAQTTGLPPKNPPRGMFRGRVFPGG